MGPILIDSGRLIEGSSPVELALPVGLAEGLEESVALDVGVDESVGLADGVELSVGLALGVELSVALAVGLELSVGLALAVGLELSVELALTVGLGLSVGLAEDAADDVGLGLKMLERPENGLEGRSPELVALGLLVSVGVAEGLEDATVFVALADEVSLELADVAADDEDDALDEAAEEDAALVADAELAQDEAPVDDADADEAALELEVSAEEADKAALELEDAEAEAEKGADVLDAALDAEPGIPWRTVLYSTIHHFVHFGYLWSLIFTQSPLDRALGTVHHFYQ